MARQLRVEIIGDASSLSRSLGSATKSSSGFGSSFGKIAAAAGIAGGAIAGASVIVKGFIDKASEAKVSQQQMETQLKASGIAYKEHAAAIETAIQKTSMLAGVDDEDLQGAFTAIVRSTKDVNKGLEGMALASDIAAARGMDLKTAGELVGKVYAGKTAVLGRYGIVLKEGATATEAITELQKRFAGQGEATATAQGKLGVVLENLQEKLGAKLLPMFERFVNFLIKNMPAIEKTVNETLVPIGEAIMGIAKAIEPVMPVLLSFAKFMLTVMVAPLKVIVALLKGDWGAAWTAAKAPVLALVDVLGNVYSTVLQPLMAKFTELAGWVGAKLGEVVGFFTGLPGRIAATIGGLVSTAFGPIKDAFMSVVNWYRDKITDIVGFYISLPGRIAATIGSLISRAFEPIKNAFLSVVNFYRDKVTDIVGFYISLPGRIAAFIGDLVSTAFVPIKNAFLSVVDFYRDKVTAIVGFYLSLPGRIAATIGSLVSTALNPFKEAFSTVSDVVIGGLDKIRDGIVWIGNKAGGILKLAEAPFRAAGSFLSSALGPLVSILNTIIGLIKDILALWDSLPFVGGGGEKQAPGTNAGGVPAAEGGPVRRGERYLVGEQGPEMFVPDQSGRIMTAAQTRSILAGPKVTLQEFGKGHDSSEALKEALLEFIESGTKRWTPGPGFWAAWERYFGPMGKGGIITKPGLYFGAEKGPEAVIPLRGGMKNIAGGPPVIINVQGDVLDADQWARKMAGPIESALARKLTRNRTLAFQ